ncbi:MAG TPA: GNAT family N-acetyltransferase [Verrucomicrobiae bacterium]|jgi:N-acetylglutamate synthase-like GNAT family acetyltransferase|nr:GNAT family N-acetyltransferase [Verrucomicrobiae bacterium]
MSQPVSIRRFREDDKEAIKGLITAIMAREFKEDQGAYPITDIEQIEKAYGNIGDIFFIAEDGNKVIGTVAIKKEDERIALLRRLFVSLDYRKKQIGQKLLERALKFCQEVGYQELVFKTTSRMQGAILLCQKKGFVQRAKIQLGDIELLKFTLSLRDGHKSGESF